MARNPKYKYHIFFQLFYRFCLHLERIYTGKTTEPSDHYIVLYVCFRSSISYGSKTCVTQRQGCGSTSI